MSELDSTACQEFEGLIDHDVGEQPLQDFLEKHPEVLLRTFDHGAYFPTLFPKFRLADEFNSGFRYNRAPNIMDMERRPDRDRTRSEREDSVQ